MRGCRPYYDQVAVEHLNNLEPEERNRVYKMLDLKVLAHEDANLEVKWTLGGNLCRDNEPLPRWSFADTTFAPRFRAVLTGNGSGGWELVEANVCVDPGH